MDVLWNNRDGEHVMNVTYSKLVMPKAWQESRWVAMRRGSKFRQVVQEPSIVIPLSNRCVVLAAAELLS